MDNRINQEEDKCVNLSVAQVKDEKLRITPEGNVLWTHCATGNGWRNDKIKGHHLLREAQYHPIKPHHFSLPEHLSHTPTHICICSPDLFIDSITIRREIP